jgi:hypothetical protein
MFIMLLGTLKKKTRDATILPEEEIENEHENDSVEVHFSPENHSEFDNNNQGENETDNP